MIDEENQSLELEELSDEEVDLDSLIAETDNPPKVVEVQAEPATSQISEQPGTTDAETELKSEQKAERESAASTQKIETLMTEVIALKRQVEDRTGQYTRLYADFDNFRKRTQREKEEEEDRINAKVLKKFLPVIDDFERAQSQIKPKTDAENAIHTSYQSVYKQLVKSLKEAGVVRMRAVGQEFDPNYHEAIAQELTDEYDEGNVCEELRPGYLLGERVLRHALVKVAIGKTPSAPESSEATVEEATESSEELTENETGDYEAAN
jgi:molecular chaperone GrpE